MSEKRNKTTIRVYYCRNIGYDQKAPAAILDSSMRDYVILEAVPCSGKIDPRYIMKGFETGIDSMCILACPQGQCKSFEGNYRALSRIEAVRELIAEAGLDTRSVEVILPEDDSEEAFDRAIVSLVDFLQERLNKTSEVAA